MYSYFFLKSPEEGNTNKPSNWLGQCGNTGKFTSFCCNDLYVTFEYCGLTFYAYFVLNNCLFSQSDKACMAGHCLVTMPEMHTLLAFFHECYFPVLYNGNVLNMI
jgi:hypothetical protein